MVEPAPHGGLGSQQPASRSDPVVGRRFGDELRGRRPGPTSRSGLWIGCLGFLGLLLVVGVGYGHCSCFVVVAACLCWLWSSSFLLLLLLLAVAVAVAVKYHAHFPFMCGTHFTHMTYLFGSRQKE